MFSLVFTIVSIGFSAVLGLIIYRMIQGLRLWSKNNQSPVLSVEAFVAAKRMSVSHHHHNQGDAAMGHSSSSTIYFATFEVESGERMEMMVPDTEYGMLAEGDFGTLTYQGTRYKGFKRDMGGQSYN